MTLPAATLRPVREVHDIHIRLKHLSRDDFRKEITLYFRIQRKKEEARTKPAREHAGLRKLCENYKRKFGPMIQN